MIKYVLITLLKFTKSERNHIQLLYLWIYSVLTGKKINILENIPVTFKIISVNYLYYLEFGIWDIPALAMQPVFKATLHF